ncbi:glycoside hydrolase family 3 C-terminal domain-containing protein [Modestobacter sp. VKM Ac-2979]|uniref:glycoside hydrolase family 3 C-terminal domain-containing protein n=1 Tax=unclassified Modestobacter TaxID=2643866 RepID=UPI0022AB8889|nr:MULTISPECIES: glycoside hydrolase family 3 C-terminal domain-containing protein [unclassified Modestobacter]MCZ2814170.1 glycoside hydrolase family 3 C-terminal domain-containing protein [Modestobacter sp. VKM Ac-2979]MCZ2844414.1 glycoside hydrolase family 3 C-terminal domain-containing protein [Modestobacter sp. VKM Ac-2980]
MTATTPSDPTALPLEQKAALLSGQDFWSTPPVEAAGLPSVVLTDGPHGVRRQVGDLDQIGLIESVPATCFPPAVAVGSSWDPETAERIGAAIGVEARAIGVPVVLGPGVNIKRSPLCGRNFEYYSEDPLLAGVLGAAHVRGQQGAGVGASVKHFAANNQETQRMQVSADVDERTLREIYLPAFERVVTEAQPATVMCAYNKVNGVYASQHRWLLTEVLREEWGFTGAVVSDWGAVDDRVAALEAGLDLQMPGDHGAGNALVVDAVRSGRLEESVVDRSVRRVAALAGYVGEPTDGFDADAHHALARELATGCAVLLKNDGGALPLAPGQRVAVVGEFARTPRFQGGGSSHVNATRVDDALTALQAVHPDLAFAPGYALDGAGDATALREEAVGLARDAGVTVVFAGLAEADETEGVDRTHLDLPAAQVELIRAVAAVSARTVVVLSSGSVVSLEGWHDDVDAVLAGFLLGQAGGSALADLLTGVADPSGRLAETIPLRLADTPSFLDFPGEQGHVRYAEGVMVGYRQFVTVDRPVRYPFGHGLSYTTFTTSDLEVRTVGDDAATVTLTVTNTGARAGRHVVQVYVATTAGPVRRPARELRAFTKVSLAAGESTTVAFELGRRAFAYWDVREHAWVVAPGEHTVQIGRSATDVVDERTIDLAGDVVVRELTLQSSVAEWFEHPVAGPQLLEGFLATMPEGAGEMHAGMLQMIGSMPMRRFAADFGGAIPAEELERLMAAARAAR